VSGTFSAQFNSVPEGHAKIIQYVIVPASPTVPTPDDRDKVADNTFNVIVRLGAAGEHADKLLKNLYSPFSSVQSHGAKFVARRVFQASGRINRRAGTWGFSAFLNAHELSSIVFRLDGTGMRRARRIPPTIMHEGPGPGLIPVGTSNFGKLRRQVAIPIQSLQTHVYLTGPSGSGKTILLQNLTLGGINEGLGAFVFDPKGGDLVKGILRGIPEHRKDDVIYWNPMDSVAAIGFNPLNGDPGQVAGHMTSVMSLLFKDSWGPRLEMYIKHIFTTAAAAELTLYDCYVMLVNDAYRKTVLAKVRAKLHPDTRGFWTVYEQGSEVAKHTVINKLDKIVVSNVGHRVFSQHSGLDMAEILRKGQILLVPMNMAEVGEANEAVGLLCQEMIINAVMRRSEQESERTHLLVQDEYQHFAGISTSKFEPWACGLRAWRSLRPTNLPGSCRNRFRRPSV
jgi:hypothetical protein